LAASGPWKCVTHWSFVPLGFHQRCRITTRHPAPFHHALADRHRDASQATPRRVDQDLSKLIDLREVSGSGPRGWRDTRQQTGTHTLAPGELAELVAIEGAGAIATLRVTLPRDQRGLDSLWITMDWDGAKNQVEVPLKFLFGAGVNWQDIPSVCI